MIKVMNAAVMPHEGIYISRRVDEATARFFFQKFKDKYGWESYVGYPQNVPYMSKVLGVEIPINRSETKLEHGDIMLVCKLRYRIQDPTQKATLEPKDDDFEWFVITYKRYWDGVEGTEVSMEE